MEVKLFESFEEARKQLIEKEPRLVRANGKSICIVMLGNRLIAFENLCPHMGAELHTGKVNYLNQVVCPLHTYRFDIHSGEEAENRCSSLRFISIVLNENGIFLSV